MHRYLRVMASALLLLTITTPALAEDIWVFSDGNPSLLAKIPDGWTVGKERIGVLSVIDRYPAHIAFSFHLLRDARDPEDFVTQEMRSAGGPVPTEKTPIQLAGLSGWLFKSNGKNPSGVELETDHYIARLDSTYLIAIAVVYPPDAPQSDREIIQNVLASLKVNGNPSK
ncbi:MAG TPA: hypothetical protein VGH91_12060 [Gammaproteobacteria bacterium]|jgi:hypothetical protein